MSDPVSSADIEDVLSSIRRLVSEEPAGGKSRREPAEDADAERFVLTPAFRIAEADGGAEEEEAPAPDEAGDAEAADHGAQDQPVAEVARFPVRDPQIPENYQDDSEWADGPFAMEEETPDPEPAADIEPEPRKPMAELSLEERIAELEAALEHAPQEWEPDGSEDGSSDETRPLSYDAGAGASEPEETVAEPVSGGAGVAGEAESEEGREAQAMALELPESWQADLEDARASRKSQDDPAQDDEPVAAGQGAHDEAETSDGEEAQGDAPVIAVPEAGAGSEPGDPVAEWHDVEPEFVHAPAAPVDEAEPIEGLAAWDVSASHEAGEPVRYDEEDEPAEAEPDALAAAEAEASANAEKAAEPDDIGNFLADDEAMLDEETLREMVSDLVRQELQGVLGERITRNVRRLVRREIQRAMAMRDLE